MSEHLTSDVLREAIAALTREAEEYPLGRPHTHLVHPREYERGGYARCADCFEVIDIDALKAAQEARR